MALMKKIKRPNKKTITITLYFLPNHYYFKLEYTLTYKYDLIDTNSNIGIYFIIKINNVNYFKII